MNPFAYDWTRGTVSGFLHLVYRLRVTGREKLPQSGSVILAANHVSYFDPPVVAVASPRRLTFLAKKELFAYPPFGRYLRAVGAYPLDRSQGDTAAVRYAVTKLREGNALLIFPEGSRNIDGKAEAKNGVALLARLSGAPIVPVGIVGTEATRRLTQIHIAFGDPIAYDEEVHKGHAGLELLRDTVMQAITDLKTVARERSAKVHAD